MRQEPHRVYWQQWGTSSSSSSSTSTSNTNDATTTATTSSEQPSPVVLLTTSSAAVRISDAARAMDVTLLLRQTVLKTSLNQNFNEKHQEEDVLVLVGTLYNLPPIQFEHEPPQSVTMTTTTMTTTTTTTATMMTEPCHFLRTLKPHENPLLVRDQVLQQLKERQAQTRGSMSPKLQWFYVPSSNQPCDIPNCIQLDGYCSATEEDDDTDDKEQEEEEEDDDDDDDDDSLESDTGGDDSFWWRKKSPPTTSTFRSRKGRAAIESPRRDASTATSTATSKLLWREQCRLNQLRNSLNRRSISGFLLQRSSKDPHVWRRVHCVLQDDYFWFVSRLYSITSHNGDTTIRYAKHGRISLNRALLLEPSSSSCLPLSRIPYCFEIVSKSGKSHVFRASSRIHQLKWIQALGGGIVTCHESMQLEHAELILRDEVKARNKRLTTIAVEPLLPCLITTTATAASFDTNGHGNVDIVDDERKRMDAILRLGMKVAEYKEACRHVQSRLPAKQPVVVVVSSSSTTLMNESDDNVPVAPMSNGVDVVKDDDHKNGNDDDDDDVDSAMDSNTRKLIRSTWSMAATLCVDAAHIILSKEALETNSSTKLPTMHNKRTTLCQHVDYVIWGKIRPLSEIGKASTTAITITTTATMEHASNNLWLDPPPCNLLDPLLLELQSGCNNSNTSCDIDKQIETVAGRDAN